MNKASFFRIALIFFSFLFSSAHFAYAKEVASTPSIIVQGLLKGAAVLVIDGQQRYVKQGSTSPEGVLLVRADSKGALIEMNGQRHTLSLSKQIGTAYSEPEQKEVRLSSGNNGHFFTAIRINGHTVQSLVDTGASSVALSSRVADQLGLRYKNGPATRVATAQGITKGFQVILRKVSVGDIEATNVSAIVLEGEYPLEVLLGNTFLSQVDMRVDDGVMIMRTKY